MAENVVGTVKRKGSAANKPKSGVDKKQSGGKPAALSAPRPLLEVFLYESLVELFLVLDTQRSLYGRVVSFCTEPDKQESRNAMYKVQTDLCCAVAAALDEEDNEIAIEVI